MRSESEHYPTREYYPALIKIPLILYYLLYNINLYED